MMKLIVPLLVTLCTGAIQLVVVKLAFCWRLNPVEGNAHETRALLVAVSAIVSNGAPGVCTANKLQKPPTREKLPPVIGPPASGWPIVPLTEYTPLVLVPPPPSMVNQSME